MIENARISDALEIALGRARDLANGVALVGYGVAVLRGPEGNVKQVVPFANLVTDAGDQYYAKKAITAIAPANATAPTAASCMKLGTNSTAVTKSGANSALVTYLNASNVAFDSTYPQAAAVGTDQGWNAAYQTTWGPGTATSANINEVVIAVDNANATSTAANTISRAVISTVNKAAGDTLTITWNHKFLGS